MARISPLIILPPAIFAALAGLFAAGMLRDNPDELPSALIGREAPLTETGTLSGKPPFDPAVLSDGEVKLVNFWASWCGPCREELPFLMELAARNKKKPFQLITVNIDDNDENMEKFLSRIWSQSGVLLIDRKKEIPKLYDLETMQTTVFIDREGIIRYWHDGFKESHKDLYEEELRLLLAEK